MEKDKVAEHGDEAEEAEAGHDVDDGVLQIKLSWGAEIRKQKILWQIGCLSHWLVGIISISLLFLHNYPA